MNIKGDYLLVLQLFTGLFWTVAYILIIVRDFQDKTYGMPMAALCANISWEFIFSFIYPHEILQRIIVIIWFSLDAIIVLQFLYYGIKDFEKSLPAKYFYPAFLLAISLSFIIIMAITAEFGDLMGMYAAFSQNLMMSVLFIPLLLKRGGLAGQSIYIAVFKMVGSMCAAIAFWLYFKSVLINVISVGTLVYDLIYIIFIYKMAIKLRINPWHGCSKSKNSCNIVNI